MAHDVFVSYSTKDKTIADAVCAKLEENKIRVWIAPRDIPSGSNFAESIIKAINTCKIFVLIWSAHTNSSEHILNEINQAFDQGITIIPFRIQDIQPTDAMRYYFGRTHWLDAIDPPLENHIVKLRNTILVNLGRELKPAIEKAEADKPPVISPRQKKTQIIDREIQPAGAAPANLARFIPIAAGGLAVITLVVLFISGVFKSSPSAEIAEVSPSPTGTSSPTATSTPIPVWAEEISGPILTAIKDHPPDFTDDFSVDRNDWIYRTTLLHSDKYCSNTDGAAMDVSEGSLKISVDSNCPQAVITHPLLMGYTNYLMQADINFNEQQNGMIAFDKFFDNGMELNFILNSSGNCTLQQNRQLEQPSGEITGVYLFDASKPVTVTIISKDSKALVYLDETLKMSANDLELFYGPGDIVLNIFNENRSGIFELDNVKIWDLDRIEY